MDTSTQDRLYSTEDTFEIVNWTWSTTKKILITQSHIADDTSNTLETITDL